MGMSTDAILCTGVLLPWGPEEEAGEGPWVDEDEGEYDAEEWLDNLMGPDHGLTIEVHCSGEYSMYICAVAKTVKTAHRGYPIVVDGSLMLNMWDCEKLQRFLKKVAAAYPDATDWTALKPGWVLASYMG